MPLHHHLLAGTYHPLRWARALGRPLGISPPPSLRVLLYHDIAPENRPGFAAQLRWLSRSWKFVSADQFAAMVSGGEPIRGRNLLLTFDDGFASNRVVAEEVLNPMGVRALFFAVSDFVALTDRLEARRFIARHIEPGAVAERLPAHLYNMGWSDLEALLEQGHHIGGHTRSHARLSQVRSVPVLEQEIIASADTLAQRLGTAIDHFAYTFGDVSSFSGQALAMARRRFRFVYSGLRGDNAGGVSPLALRRDAANARDATALLGAYMEGLADFRFARSRARLGAWI